jgi:hypothetical protein
MEPMEAIQASFDYSDLENPMGKRLKDDCILIGQQCQSNLFNKRDAAKRETLNILKES